ncbi:hypothetical protein EKK58_04380 [Candidatus Dependentiae bacterium]|nr:MAG: hypothetical protein EKK58_04380 [Candidatus Dependentiae bacterium]
MTETHCEEYITALNNIIDACDEATTNKNDLETLINILITKDTQINTDILTMPLISSMVHMDKYTFVQNNRFSKIDLQRALYKLVDVRNADLLNQAVNQTTTQEEQDAYALETLNIKNYVDTVINSCTCMSGRKYVINKCSN